MPSPFPEMDPYVEAAGLWHDFHARLIPALCDAIADRLPDAYLARIEERMSLVEVPAEGVRSFRPDLTVSRQGADRPSGSPAAGALALAPEVISVKYLDEVRETYLEIHQLPGQRLVTVVELLSPGNKAGGGRRDYLLKRNALLHQDVNIVELDLLVAGRRPPMERPLPAGDYYAFVARAERRPECDVFAWGVRRSLPNVPIPLVPPDPDVLVDLAPIVSGVYDRGRYARTIDYQAPLTLPLDSDDRAWAETRARGADR